MFITLTINTQARNKAVLKLKSAPVNSIRGWRKADYIRKESFTHKLKRLAKPFTQRQYRMDGQIAMV